MGTHKRKAVRIDVEFKELTPKDWQQIFAIQFPKATRLAIGLLFAYNGRGHAGELLQGVWSRAMQINQLFIKHGLPYRLRRALLPKDKQVNSGYAIDKEELLLCTVV